jgi:hypothetical protein
VKGSSKPSIAGVFGLWLILFTTQGMSSTLSELHELGSLQLRTSLSKVSNVVPGQQIKLTLEIATDRSFGGGTRIEVPEVAGLVILQTESFASNSSEVREGISWVIQRWNLDVYAQREGTFSIPSISARVKVSEEGGALIEGSVSGPALVFSATRPESLRRAQAWVAAPSFSATQTFDSDLENLVVGDAIERKILFTAEDVMAMMLPTFKEPKLNGFTRYSEPPKLKNRSNRGTTIASRELTLTYIIEAPGEYQLPAQEYFWWDTRSNEVELVSIPAVSINVGAGNPTGNTTGNPGGDKNTNYRQIVFWILAASLVLICIIGTAKKLSIASGLARAKKHWNLLHEQWRRIRKPALPQALNPGSSSEG